MNMDILTALKSWLPSVIFHPVIPKKVLYFKRQSSSLFPPFNLATHKSPFTSIFQQNISKQKFERFLCQTLLFTFSLSKHFIILQCFLITICFLFFSFSWLGSSCQTILMVITMCTCWCWCWSWYSFWMNSSLPTFCWTWCWCWCFFWMNPSLPTFCWSWCLDMLLDGWPLYICTRGKGLFFGSNNGFLRIQIDIHMS